MKELVEYLASSLVDNPSDVHVEESRENQQQKLQYALSVKQDDLGKVIGKKGRTVKAMRVLLSAFASMQGREVGLQVIEPPSAEDASVEDASVEDVSVEDASAEGTSGENAAIEKPQDQ